MSVVSAQTVPEMLWYDWTLVYCGLSVGIGLVFQIIDYSLVDEKKKNKSLYTAANFWLIMSGVIHVSTFS